MPVQVDFVTLVAALAIFLLLLLGFFLLPLMIQLKNTARRMEDFLIQTEREFIPMLREMRETAGHINGIAAEAEKGMVQAQNLFASMGEVGESIHKVNHFLQHDVGHYAGNLAGLWMGFRAGSKVLLKELAKQKRGD